jgi:uncharacterized DUF497 family protein
VETVKTFHRTSKGGSCGAPGNTVDTDPDHSLPERRFITVGMSSAGKVLIAAHGDRDENTRIISARKTTQRERKHYEEEN